MSHYLAADLGPRRGRLEIEEVHGQTPGSTGTKKGLRDAG
jgi:hypothetical protein